MISPGLNQFRVTYEISPIFLTNGIAANIPGSGYPIISITQAHDYSQGILNGTANTDLNDYFAHFRPVAGATLIDNQYGQYPFANQTVAANAVITQPLRISLLMYCPVRDAGGYQSKVATFNAVQKTLAQHINLGGTFTIATPSYFYTNCLLVNLRDVTDNGSKQAQDVWQWDFTQPLLTLEQAQQVQNSLIDKITKQVPTPGDPPSYSGLAPTVGNPFSGVSTSLIPAASSLAGAFGASGGGNSTALVNQVSSISSVITSNPSAAQAIQAFNSASALASGGQIAMVSAGLNLMGAVNAITPKAVYTAQTAVLSAGQAAVGLATANNALDAAQAVLNAANSASIRANAGSATVKAISAINTVVTLAENHVTACQAAVGAQF